MACRELNGGHPSLIWVTYNGDSMGFNGINFMGQIWTDHENHDGNKFE
jgi:hypothetical protein